RRFVGDEPVVRAVSIAAVTLGTPLFWYTFRFPIGTHVAALLFVTLFVERLTSIEDDERWGLVLAGIWLGLAAITRLQHIVLIVPAIWWLFSQGRQWKRSAVVIGLAAGMVLLVQGAAWYAVYGNPLGPLVSGAAHGGTTYIPFQKVRLAEVLFSWYHGLFTWSPLVLVGIAGWFLALRSSGPVRAFAIFAFLAIGTEWAANGLMDRYFWGGLSFGSRRFLELAPFVAVGVGLVVRNARPIISSLLVLFSVGWSIALTIAALGGSLDLARPVSFRMILNAVLSPGRLELSGRPGLILLTAGLVITAVVGWSIFVMVREKRRGALFLTTYLIVCVCAILAMVPSTRARAGEQARQAGVDVELSRAFGPLLDQRKLVRDELEYLRRAGRTEEAEASRREIEHLDRKLRDLRD
ncbi:MAG: glycosyltransferase family 39 protein, partial [Thermoanaerobaculia bacterium]|nr:glycosyltransferase family 39 protein [Thermoanaerobaculia bacterium]